jgi:hypothetical protein
MEVAAAKLIGAGLAMIGTIGAGLGIGVLVSGAVQGIARNPEEEVVEPDAYCIFGSMQLQSSHHHRF